MGTARINLRIHVLSWGIDVIQNDIAAAAPVRILPGNHTTQEYDLGRMPESRTSHKENGSRRREPSLRWAILDSNQ
ncbi:MAG: hypothetical protein AB7G88_14620 [Thermomicrobiales bacterium]